MQTITDEQVNSILALFNKNAPARTEPVREDNPFAEHSLTDLSHGLMKGADNMPAVNMAAKAQKSTEPYEMEAGRFETAKQGQVDKANKRKVAARSRAARKLALDEIANKPIIPSPERMRLAWDAVVHLTPIIDNVAKSKQRWANRLLGSEANEIPSMALEKIALVLGKQDKYDADLVVLAAEGLALSERGIPGDQIAKPDDEKDVKRYFKVRKWLMGLIYNRVMGAVVDAYTSVNNLRWDNLDIITTVMETVRGGLEDPLTSRFKADKAPAFLGTRFQAPGSLNHDALTAAIAAAITERGLDALVEYILDNRRVDGAIPWREHAQNIFLLTPDGDGQFLWDSILSVTTGLNRNGEPWTEERSRKVQGELAMKHARNLFEWMPSFIVSAVEAFDPHFIGWSTTGHRAILASDFELFYLPEPDSVRQVAVPALRYGSAEEAARMVVTHLSHLVTGQDMMRELVNA